MLRKYKAKEKVAIYCKIDSVSTTLEMARIVVGNSLTVDIRNIIIT